MPTYFQEGKVIAESNDIAVYEWEDNLYLERGPGHTLWADSLELSEYIEQIGHTPNGNCLEIGLGLGIASKYILLHDEVTLLTTVEINSDVVYVYKQLNFDNKRHKIVCQNGLEFLDETEEEYDFIFLDFYDIIDEETLHIIHNYVTVCKDKLTDNGALVGWFDIYTPKALSQEFYKLFEK